MLRALIAATVLLLGACAHVGQDQHFYRSPGAVEAYRRLVGHSERLSSAALLELDDGLL